MNEAWGWSLNSSGGADRPPPEQRCDSASCRCLPACRARWLGNSPSRIVSPLTLPVALRQTICNNRTEENGQRAQRTSRLFPPEPLGGAARELVRWPHGAGSRAPIPCSTPRANPSAKPPWNRNGVLLETSPGLQVNALLLVVYEVPNGRTVIAGAVVPSMAGSRALPTFADKNHG